MATGCTAGAIILICSGTSMSSITAARSSTCLCALRQSISAFFNFFTVLLLPAALLGIAAGSNCLCGPHPAVCTVLVPYKTYQQDGLSKRYWSPLSSPGVSCVVNRSTWIKPADLYHLGTNSSAPSRKNCPMPPVYGITRPAAPGTRSDQFSASLADDQRCLANPQLER